MSGMTRTHLPESTTPETKKPALFALTNSLATTAEIPFTDSSMMGVIIPSGSSITTLQIYAAIKPGGTYSPAYDETGTVLPTVTVAADRAVMLNPKIAPWGAIKLVANAAGDVLVSRKS